MVSLRQRSARPSYTSMAGLEDLSDGESRSENEDAAEGSGSNRHQQKAAAGSVRDDTDSISSGASSEFRMDVDGGGKGNGKGKGKGKAKRGDGAGGRDDSASAFEDEDEDEDDDLDDDLDEDASVDMDSNGDEDVSVIDDRGEDGGIDGGIGFANASGRGRGRGRGRGGGRGRGRGRGRGAAAGTPGYREGSAATSTMAPAAGASGSTLPSYAYAGGSASTASSGNPSILPPAYRNVIAISAEVLSKGSTAKGPAGAIADRLELDQYRRVGVDGLSSGPVTPFQTRLIRKPREGGDGGGEGDREGLSELEWTFEDPDGEIRKTSRREKLWLVEGHVPLLMPRELWSGEGWWREMYDPATASVDHAAAGDGAVGGAKGKGRDAGLSRGWKLREDVSLGLEGVGRVDARDLSVLSASEARGYLPTADNVVCHVGPSFAQERRDLPTLSAHTLKTPALERDSIALATGGPVWGVDWCPVPSNGARQYLAISTLKGINDQPGIGTRRDEMEKGCIQIWSIGSGSGQGHDAEDGAGEGNGARCEIFLCLRGGGVLDLKWMPLGAYDDIADAAGGLPKLGIVAAVQLDGSVAFYSVPQPDALRAALSQGGDAQPVFLEMSNPLLRLEVPDASALCLDWMTGSRVVVGLSNGHGIVWDVRQALRGEISSEDLLPLSYLAVSGTPLRSVAAVRHPISDNRGKTRWDSYPPYAVFGSYEGSLMLADMREPNDPIEINKQRRPAAAVAWSHQNAAPLYADVDGITAYQRVFTAMKIRSTGVTISRGSVWSIATSDYHTNLAVASADGSVVLGPMLMGFHRKRKVPMMYHRLYEMDYDKHTNEYRMIDNFKPSDMAFGMSSDRLMPKNQAVAETTPEYVWSAAWAPEVGVHKVVWNSNGGLGNAGWLASGTASGICRVDWIEGRFSDERTY